VGLMIACLMAALMSTADCLMITCSSLLTHNLYRPLIRGRSERHYIFIGRIIGGFVVIGGGLIATQFDTILQLLKLIWELNVMVAASFWLGMKWRKANRKGAWCSIVATTVLFYVFPIFLPMCWTSLRSNPVLLKTTHPEPMLRRYAVHEMDVIERQNEIEKWEKLSDTEKTQSTRPELLVVGQRFEKRFVLPDKSIYWTKGIGMVDGDARGLGTLSLELVLLDKLGFDLSRNPYALNETIRILIRMITPFFILVVVSLLTRPDDKQRLDKFFVKMKTVVLNDRKADAENLELSYADPHRFDSHKLFPKSSWELDRWDKADYVGFLLSVLGILAVVVLLVALVSIGG